MLRHARLVLALALAATFITACGSTPKTDAEKDAAVTEARATVKKFLAKDPQLKSWFDSAYAYAVFPTIAKGGAVVGGAHGTGTVFEGGKAIGFCELSQGSFGLQLGGQAYSEVIFFETKATLDTFTSGSFEFAAQASAVAATAGASTNVDYERGVAVFTIAGGGLMAEASIGGQKFSFERK